MLMSLPWKTSCGKNSCFGCPSFHDDPFNVHCSDGYDISDVAYLIEHEESTPFDVR